MSQGSPAVFFSNWLVGGITGLAIVMLLWPVVSRALATVRRSLA
jgi:putative tricarboxylic transport membrane protein